MDKHTKTESERLLSYLGLAEKAQKLVSGAEACEQTIKSGDVYLTVVSPDAGENTKKHFSDMSGFRKIPFVVSPEPIGHAIGHDTRKVACVTDKGFAEAMIKTCGGLKIYE